ncbi:MAG: DUF2802 domain-containing protein [Betaproteobacteria bacterium]
MEIEVLANLSWREGLIAIVVLLVVYLLVVFLRFNRLQREKNTANLPDTLALNSAIAAYAAVQKPETNDASGVAAPPETAAVAPTPPAFDFPWNEAPPPAVGQEQVDALEREVNQLRKEVGGLRAEILIMREEQRREPEKTPVTQNVSPLYSDAMQMAIQGQDAASISHYCGISRAEAELVVALVRNRDNDN